MSGSNARFVSVAAVAYLPPLRAFGRYRQRDGKWLLVYSPTAGEEETQEWADFKVEGDDAIIWRSQVGNRERGGGGGEQGSAWVRARSNVWVRCVRSKRSVCIHATEPRLVLVGLGLGDRERGGGGGEQGSDVWPRVRCVRSKRSGCINAAAPRTNTQRGGRVVGPGARLVVQVPAYIEAGETIKVDTRDAHFVERVKS